MSDGTAIPASGETGDPKFIHVGRAQKHDSAEKHVCGTAQYVDDLPEPEGTLHVAPGWSREAASGRIVSLDLEAVKAAPGVVAVLTAADVPGENDCSPSIGGDPILANGEILFWGQVVFAVVARTRTEARKATLLAKIEVEATAPIVSVDCALVNDTTVLPDYQFRKGQPEAALDTSNQRLSGVMRIGGQEHFYLEGQISMAVPGEDGDMFVHCSTQHPSEVQHIVAKTLGVIDAGVTIEVRRMGGAFGGKESQANQWAALSAIAARHTGKPCKMRLDRDDDMTMTGKRHDFRVDYTVGFENDGAIHGVDMAFAARCGYSADLSLGVVDRTMFHADSSYCYPDALITSRRMRTNTCSATAFRGFGGPQGMLAAERLIDSIAITLGLDPLDVRKRNFYDRDSDITPYGMRVEEFATQHAIVTELEETCDYRARRDAIRSFNASSHILKKGLALTPVKFGIAFTLPQLNQAGALVHLYQDGSVHLNHGGTEMGQGLYTKVAQVVAQAFSVPLSKVKITATHTGKVPNTGPTAASSGTDLNAMAALQAVEKLKKRLTDFASDKYGVPVDQIEFRDGKVMIGTEPVLLGQLAKAAIMARVQLSATGFYATPKITWNRQTSTGRPFLYFAFGAACSEVLVDTMTGEMRVTRVDILHDVGRSLNPALDIGQIEGGFVQGMGWLTTEELVWDDQGRLRTHAPSTYKIPTASDVPEEFHVKLYESVGNPEATIHRSKAVGEPPVMLANSVFCAIVDAVASLKPGVIPPLDAPATPEAILAAVDAVKGARPS